jgi:AcrR family transcriptional regulator
MPAADRRQAILDAALGVFAKAGYHEASLEAVAARAGISKALIYEHFVSKQELHQALLDTYGAELVGRITTTIATTDPGEPRLRAGVEAFLAYVEELPDAWRVVFRHLEDPGVAEWLERMRTQVAGTISELISRDAPLTPGGAPPDIDRVAPMLAQQMIGAVLSLGTWWDEHPDVTADEMLAAIMNFAWLGLDRLSAGERWSA